MPSGATHVQSMQGYHRPPEYTNGDESAASILQSVKDQEAQFEALTRELEAERQSVANQLERCKLGSETASMSSISDTDDSFHWKGHQTATATESHLEEDSEGEHSHAGDTQLVDSCLRVLQERGIMNTSDRLERLPEDSSLQHSDYRKDGPVNDYTPRDYGPTPGSPHGSQGSYQSGGSNSRYQQQPSLAKIVTTREVRRNTGSVSSHLSEERGGSNYVSYSSYPQEAPREPLPSRFIDNTSYDGDAYNDYQQYPPDQFENARDPEPERYDQGRANDYSNYSDFEQPPPTHGNYANVPPPGADPQYPDEANPYNKEGVYNGYGGEPNDSFQEGIRPQYNTDNYHNLPPLEDHNLPPLEHDQYRQSPNPDGVYRQSPKPFNHQGHNPDPYYPPEDRYVDDQLADRYGERPDENYSRHPNDGRYVEQFRGGDNYEHYPGDADHPREGYHGDPPDNQPEERYTERPIDNYTERPTDNYMEHPGVRYVDPPLEGRLHGDRDVNNPDDSLSDQYRPKNEPPYRGQDDSFQDGVVEPQSFHGSLQEDPYRKAPSSPGSGSERYGPPGYGDQHPGYEPERRQFADETHSPPPGSGNYGDMPPQHAFNLDPARRSPSIDSQTRDRWRGPELPEVVEFLSHPSDAIKANAAAYLQHLCYMDDNMKAKTRSMNAIPALVELVNNEIPEVHRNACGALKNLSFGRANEENKKAIKNAGGIPALIRLLRKTPDNDVRELVTGVLWNLSSSKDLKRPIIDDGLTVIVNSVIIPHSGWDKNMDEDAKPRDVYWSFVFRNASGILRNVSSDGEYARKKLRECEGLVDALVYLVRAAIGKNDIDNKSVENCICIMRNLSFRCQEVEDPDFHKKRTLNRQALNDTEKVGCFGASKKKKHQQIEQRNRSDSGYQSRPRLGSGRGMDLLWQPEIVHVYLPLLSDCSNPETLEAAAGAIQNLAACDWQPSIEIRSQVRKEKGLPIIVELLGIEADRVVCAAATALRNLALDQRNKELIGKYAMRQLVQKLPSEVKAVEHAPSDETVAAVIATLHEVVKKNADFAGALLHENGVERLIIIKNSRQRFSPKVVKFSQVILNLMWQFKELHQEFKRQGFRDHHFVTKNATMPNTSNRGATPHNNTLYRPRGDLGGGNNQPSTPTPITRHAGDRAEYSYSPEADRYRRDEPPSHNMHVLRPDDIPPKDMNHGYATVESMRKRENNNAVPPGGVPLFPNLPPSQLPQPQEQPREPLYAQVDKRSRRSARPDYSPPISSSQRSLIPMEEMNNLSYGGHTNQHLRLDSPGSPPGGAGADSWV